MKKTIFNPNGIHSKDMFEIMRYCEGFIEFAMDNPYDYKLTETNKDSFEDALEGCLKISIDILRGTLEGTDKKLSSVNTKTFVTICYYAYEYIDIMQNYMPKNISKNVLHDNADEIKEKARCLVLDINETLFNNGELPEHSYLGMKNKMTKGEWNNDRE